MTTMLIPLFAFVAAMLAVLLSWGVWARYFDRGRQARRQRLQAVHDAIHRSGQKTGNVQNSQQERSLETWLHAHTKFFSRLENLIKQAGSPLAARRVMGIMLTLFLVVVALGLLRRGALLLILLLAGGMAGTPLLWLRRQAARRRQAFGDKLPETLDYISRALHAGHSLTSAIGMAGKEFPDPIGQEFKAVFDEIGFGIPFKDAIAQLAVRVQGNDIDFFVISLVIQHETGGNLTELLDGLAKTIRERIILRGKIRTLSAEGRASAWVLGSMPFVLAGILSLINPGYISLLWTTPQGRNLLLIGGGLMAIGFFSLDRIIKIKV